MKIEDFNPQAAWPAPAANETKSRPNGFFDTFMTFYQRVNQDLQVADQTVEEFAAGGRRDLHEIMIATEKAGISFRLLLQVRNKLLEAYQEVMRMQF